MCNVRVISRFDTAQWNLKEAGQLDYCAVGDPKPTGLCIYPYYNRRDMCHCCISVIIDDI